MARSWTVLLYDAAAADVAAAVAPDAAAYTCLNCQINCCLFLLLLQLQLL
jgi:hypothetical protein